MREVPEPDQADRFVVFGDGCQAIYVNDFEDDEKNELVVEMRPTGWCKYWHDITDKDEGYDVGRDIWVKRYKLDFLIRFPKSHTNFQGIFLLCDWNGKASKIWDLKYKSMSLQKDASVNLANSASLMMGAIELQHEKFSMHPKASVEESAEMSGRIVKAVKGREEKDDEKKEDGVEPT